MLYIFFHDFLYFRFSFIIIILLICYYFFSFRFVFSLFFQNIHTVFSLLFFFLYSSEDSGTISGNSHFHDYRNLREKIHKGKGYS